MAKDTSCIFSTVKNTSGGAMTFGFLPPHGRKLANNEEFTIYGDVRESIIRFERTTERRSILAFEAALARGDMQILSTPAQVLVDADDSTSKVLGLDEGVLSAVDPCWLNDEA